MVVARDFRQSETQAVFAPPTHQSHQGRDTTRPHEVPGPGHYAHNYTSAAQQEASLRSNVVFKSTFERSAENLAPGAYDVAASSDAVLAQGRLVGGRDPPNATFTSSVPRSRHLSAAVADSASKP